MAASTASAHLPTAGASAISTTLYSPGGKNAMDSPDRRRGVTEVESVLNRSLRNENDLLRCQLNDLISREKSQRIELQRLRQNREADVSSIVQSATSQLKAEVEQLKTMLQGTSGQLLQALSEREQAKNQKEQISKLLEETKHSANTKECTLTKRLQCLEEALKGSLTLAATVGDNIDSFQRHVLPTFKPTGFEMNKPPVDLSSDCPVEGKALLEQLTRLESGIALLRVIVDAKTDTLVLIRGKLKQENEELRAELQVLQEQKQGSQIPTKPMSMPNDDTCSDEKNMLRQELHSLQSLFNEEVTHLKSKLKMYESEEQQGQGRLMEVQKELTSLQDKLGLVEASRASLEASLKEETSARSQLVSQLFALRKENEKTKAELETLKLSQKFLVRQPRNGRIPVEKMDLMNTVNQLLSELDKLKSEKVALEEELKARKLSNVRDRVQRTVTSRDVEMAASSKVGDTELASKLARQRLQQLVSHDSSPNSSPNRLTTSFLHHEGIGSGISSKPSLSSYHTDSLSSDFLQGLSSFHGTTTSATTDLPFKEELMNCAALYASSLPTKV